MITLNSKDIQTLSKVKAKGEWKDLSEVGFINNIVKSLGINNEKIGLKCASHIKQISKKGNTSIKEILKGCPSLRPKKRVSKEKKYVKNYFRGRGGRGQHDNKHVNTQPTKTNTERIIEAIGAQNRASAQAAAQFQIGQTQRLLTQQNPTEFSPPHIHKAHKEYTRPPEIKQYKPLLPPQNQLTEDQKKQLGIEKWGHPNLDDDSIPTERKQELKTMDGHRNARVDSYLRGIGVQYDMRMYNKTFPPPVAFDDDGNEINWNKYKVPSNIDIRPPSARSESSVDREYRDFMSDEDLKDFLKQEKIEKQEIGKLDSWLASGAKGAVIDFGGKPFIADSDEGSITESDNSEREHATKFGQTEDYLIHKYGSQMKAKGIIPRKTGDDPFRPFSSPKIEEIGTIGGEGKLKHAREKGYYVGDGSVATSKEGSREGLMTRSEIISEYGESEARSMGLLSSRSSQNDPFGVVRDLKDATPSEAADYLLKREEIFAPKTKDELLESLSGQSFQYKSSQTKKDINEAIGEEKARLEQIQKMKAVLAPDKNQSTRESLSTKGSFKPGDGVRQELINNLAQQQEGEVHNQLHPSGVSRQSYYHSLESLREKMKNKAEMNKTRDKLRDEELGRVKQEIGTFGATLKPTEEYLKTHSAAEVFQQKKIDDAEQALIKQRQKLSKDIKGGEGEKAFYDFALNQPPKLGDTIAEEGKPSLHFLQNHSMYQYLEQQKKDKAAVAAQDENVLPEGAEFNADGTINYIPSAYSYGGLGYDDDK
jgi:hypothetical protein